MNDESSHVDENDENTHPSQDATIKPSSFASSSSSSSPSSSSSSILVADDSSMMMLLEEENADTPSPAAAVAAPENRDVSSSVMVAVRVRPLLAMEDGTDHCLRVLQNNTALQIGSSSSSAAADHEDGPQFTFDRVFDSNASQLDIFEQCVTPLVQQCIQGYNATIFAYGQTGSGKTYTIMGESTTDGRAGILPRAVQALFAALDLEKSTVKIQFLEVYGEEIRDLLTNNHGTKLSIRDVGQDTEPEVLNATQKQVSSDQEALRALTHGMLRRVTGGTAMNQASSRSHAILSIMIEQQQTICGVGGGATNNADGTSNDTSMCGDGDDSNGMEQHVQIKRSKFNFVDLAGSERQKRTQAEGKRLKEGIDINKGLLVLGNVISALGDPKKRGKTHVPYRDSKLTRLLKGSLGGNHKTLMIACVSPSSINMDESLNCLRYANRAKNIQNHAVVNVDASSKLVQELQTQVQVLAAEVLRVYESPDTTTTKQVFSKQELQALASGEALGSGALLSSSSSVPNKLVSATSYHHDESQKLRDLELELDRTREQLQESRSHHDTAEEQLYVSKAENELYKLQLSVISKDGSVPVLTEQQAFLESAKAYEAEIGKLRAALQEAESKANRMAWATTDDEQEQQALQKAKQTLEDERRRLASMQASLNVVDGVGNSLEPSPQQPPSNESIMDREEQEEQAKLQNLTEKYLSEHDSYEDKSEHDEARNDEPDEEAAPESSDASGQRQRHLEINLNELSRSIAAKEDLIEQLRLSHEKFAGMRDFYDERLRQMEQTLSEREAEREKLLHELQNTKGGNRSHSNLMSQLKEKETHIADLKNKQKELRNLTAVSSRNLSEINRLQNDVSTMKRKKVEMQKQLAEERKAFANEKKRFQKDAMQKERELNKWKQVSNQREIAAQKAQQVAKARLQELGHLRTKYKDAEQKVRVLSLKKGVMAKAGLEPILVGRRSSKQDEARSKSKNADVDRLRDHFDQKVASVVRKEALVDKLAQEWEEHFQLTTQREEMVATYGENSEEVESLSIQLKFKESRIRQFAQRLGRDHQASDETSTFSDKKSDAFLFDKELSKVCGGSVDDAAKNTIALVLFGMIVRERRRVAALARTASSLDERAHAAEKAAAGNEEALQSYMEEQRQEVAASTLAQRNQVIALMGIVKETSLGGPTAARADDSETEEHVVPNVLLLANEQISLLEQQMEELRSENQSIEGYRNQVKELNSLVETKSKEYNERQEELASFRAVLRQIREHAETQVHRGGETGMICRTICELVQDVLRSSATAPTSATRRFPGTGREARRVFSPRLKKHIELMHTSDSDGGGSDLVDWSSEIMADLALIAEGKVPPSLQGTTFDETSHSDLKPIKEKQPNVKSPTRESDNDASPNRGKSNRRAMSKQITEKLGKIVVPGSKKKPLHIDVTGSSRKPPTNPDNRHRSVFDRLGSPSNYTLSRSSHVAAQKEKDRATKVLDSLLFETEREAERERSEPHSSNYGRLDPRDAATRLLDDLLVSDSDAGLSSDRDTPKSNHDGEASEKFASYTQQDVFERLQKTTTQAYAVKQLDIVAYDVKEAPTVNRSGVKEIAMQTQQTIPIPAVVPNTEYIEQNVFERLQKTTTEAYAQKKNPPVK